jgi:hypothetical protein
MAGTPSLFAGIGAQFFDNAGNVLTGGKIFSYEAGTTTPTPTYTTEAANVAHPNPIILDASGRVPSGQIWLKEGDLTYYKFVLQNANNVLIATYDFVPGTYSSGDLGNTSDPTKGDALVGFRQSNLSGNLTGAVGRTVHQKLQEFISAEDFGVVVNDVSAAVANTARLQDAINAAADKVLVLPDGDIYFGSTLTFNRPIRFIGQNFSSLATRLIAYGSGFIRSVRTQRIAAVDGGDPPYNVALDVTSQHVDFEDFVLLNYFTVAQPYGTWGQDIDVGIMVKSEPYFTATNIRVQGYWNLAGICYDVTQNNGNCDRSVLNNVWSQGFWGLYIMGPIPPAPSTTAIPGDPRGAGGMSDFISMGGLFQGTNWFGLRRRSDTDGGGIKADGRIPNPLGRLNNQVFIQTRISTAEPYPFYLNYISRLRFIGLHVERATGYTLASDGTTPAGATYVNPTVTPNARNIQLQDVDYFNVVTDVSYADGVVVADFLGGNGTSSTYVKRMDYLPDFQPTTSFTPVLIGTVSGLTGPTPYTLQTGFATRIGKVVFIQIYITLQDKTGLSGNLRITGLPFISVNTADRLNIFDVQTTNVTFGANAKTAYAIVSDGANSMALYFEQTGLNRANMTDADVVNTSSFKITGWYEINP